MVAALVSSISFSKGSFMKTKKCPVCDWEIKDSGITVKAGGKEVVVCCDDCAKKVKENPAQYSGTAK
jgi:transcription elongation factor Elf1